MNRAAVMFLPALCLLAVAGTASAQGRSGCRSPQPPSVGVAFGVSLPYLELVPGVAGGESASSVSVRGGVQLAGRADLPVTGPLRVRVEGATARWDVRRTLYDADAGYAVLGERSIDRMSARHFVALVGVRTGRAPACAHLSAGGGLYSIGFRGASARRAGGTLAAGMEIPTGSRAAVQLDATLHLIGTRDATPIASTAVPALSLAVGWAYRF
jgi:hypothetical protein